MVRLLLQAVLLLSPLSTVPSSAIISKLRLAYPLQALTIYDPEASSSSGDGNDESTRRGRFLPKFRAGLEAEAAVRREFAEKRLEQQEALAAAAKEGTGSSNRWARRVKMAQRNLERAENKAAEAAFDKAVKEYEANQLQKQQQEQPLKRKNPNQYQFVGVIQSPSTQSSSSTESPITWFARKKPKNANWSIRLVHANRQAIIKDLFARGKVDIFGKYTNTGMTNKEDKSGTFMPVVVSEYKVRERSWKNLWNFSPKHFFTDSSGMYWRERRLRPGLYTDGETVYESSYRYRDGRNGMHKKSTLGTFLKSSSIPQKTKERILKRLKSDAPDVVLEE